MGFPIRLEMLVHWFFSLAYRRHQRFDELMFQERYPKMHVLFLLKLILVCALIHKFFVHDFICDRKDE